MNKWNSIHVFIRTNKLQDKFINYINKFINNLKNKNKIDKWFYIRYWESGPHIRLRFQGCYSEKKMIKAIKSFLLKEKEKKVVINKINYYQNINYKAEGFTNIKNIPWYKQGDVISIPYHPEFERYGGKNNICFSEDIFEWSSNITAALIAKTSDNFSLRFLLSIYITKQLIDKLPDKLFYNNKLTFLKNCFTSWKKLEPNDVPLDLEKIFSIITKKNKEFNKIVNYILNENETIEKFINVVITLQSKLYNPIQIQSIIFSQMHMTFNRLGIYPELEKKAYPLIEGILIHERK